MSVWKRSRPRISMVNWTRSPRLRKLVGPLHLDVQVVAVGVGTEAYFLELLLVNVFLLLLPLAVLLLAEVHDSAYGRTLTGGNLDEVHVHLPSHPEGVLRGDQAYLIAFMINQSYLRHADPLIDPQWLFDSDVRDSLSKILTSLRAIPPVCTSQTDFTNEVPLLPSAAYAAAWPLHFHQLSCSTCADESPSGTGRGTARRARSPSAPRYDAGHLRCQPQPPARRLPGCTAPFQA